MAKESNGIGTLDAANLTYYFEGFQVNFPKITDQDRKLEWVDSRLNIPSNLEYLEDTYDAETGTSAVAFKDTDTGEIIIAYTGTNPRAMNLVIKIL